MDRLLEGYRRFRAEVWPAERARYEALAQRGQRPETLVIACSDSRVDPQTVFGAGPGELFVVRNVAGLVPPYSPDAGYHGTSAALEFGVRVLKVARIIVLGHAQCGGIQAMVEGRAEEGRDFVEPWMAIAESVLRSFRRRRGHRSPDPLRNRGGTAVAGQPRDLPLDRGGCQCRDGCGWKASASASTPAR
jgi:carbonic anhydrase